MEKDSFAASKDEKYDENLVHNLKYVLQHSDIQDYLDNVEDEIQKKSKSIKSICENKSDELVDRFQQFFFVKERLGKLKDQMDTFEKQLELIKKRNLYDQAEVKKQQILKDNVTSTIKYLSGVMEILQVMQRAIENLKRQKYTASIRYISQLQKQLSGQSNIQPGFSKIIASTIEMINSQVHKEVESMVTQWIDTNKLKQLEYGQYAFNTYLQIIKNKIQMGGEAEKNLSISKQKLHVESVFFDRQSIYQSTYDADQASAPSPIQLLNSNEMEANMHMLQQENPFDEISEISEKDRDQKTRISMIKVLNDYAKTDVNLDIQLDLFALKQPEYIYDCMNERQLFFQLFHSHRQRLLIQTTEAENIKSQKDMKRYLQNVIGFFVIEQEILRRQPELSNIQNLWSEGKKIIEKVIKIYFCELDQENEFIPSKNEIYLFAYILHRFGYKSISSSILKLLKDSLAKYTKQLIKNAKKQIQDKILVDSLEYLRVKVKEDYDILAKIYGINQNEQKDQLNQFGVGSEPTQKQNQALELPISSILSEIALLIKHFLEESIQYLKGLTDYEGTIYIQLDQLYIEISEIFRNFVQSTSPKPTILQVSQTYNNIQYLQHSVKYYQKQIESVLKIPPNKEFECQIRLEQRRSECIEFIQVNLNSKLDTFLSNYYHVNWSPSTVRKNQHDFIQDLVDFLQGTYLTMKMINSDLVHSIIYIAFGHINERIWDILLDPKIKKFNIGALVNLENDLLCLFASCATLFAGYAKLMEKLREIRQFLDLFLVAKNPSDYLPQKHRESKYNHLVKKKLLTVLPKYNRTNIDNCPKIQKKDIEALVKQLTEETKEPSSQ